MDCFEVTHRARWGRGCLIDQRRCSALTWARRNRRTTDLQLSARLAEANKISASLTFGNFSLLPCCQFTYLCINPKTSERSSDSGHRLLTYATCSAENISPSSAMEDHWKCLHRSTNVCGSGNRAPRRRPLYANLVRIESLQPVHLPTIMRKFITQVPAIFTWAIEQHALPSDPIIPGINV